jgi:hypothetical protein
MTTYTIVGALQGGLWWPYGALAEKPVEYVFTRDDIGAPFVNTAETLADALAGLMAAEDGDFSNAPRLTADSVLLAERTSPSGRRRVLRTFSLASFGSIADYMSDAYSFGMAD